MPSLSSDNAKQPGGEQCAYYGAYNGYPAVSPVTIPFILKRQHKMCNAGTQVTGGVNGIAGRTAQ